MNSDDWNDLENLGLYFLGLLVLVIFLLFVSGCPPPIGPWLGGK